MIHRKMVKMSKKIPLLFMLSLLLLTVNGVHGQYTYKKLDNGVALYSADPVHSTRALKLEVVNDRVIRVTATPETEFSNMQSLIEKPGLTTGGNWELTEKDGILSLKTGYLEARLTLHSGGIEFRDPNGATLLKETELQARSFTPVYVEGTRGYSLQQNFESPETEAFYGLGQHQSDEFNYKNRNEQLFQYNTKVSVPFFVSTKNYGLLWDNYSYSKFGDAREYSNLNTFRLYNEDGIEQGLTARYITGEGKLFAARPESAIDYENLETIHHFPQNFPFYNSTITWNGYLEPKESGVHEFKLYYAGYTKVFMDDSLVVPERWRTAWNPNAYKFRVNMVSGRKHKIRVEWKPDGGVSYLGLKVLTPLPEQEAGRLRLWSEMGKEIRYYFIAGNSLDEVISGYRHVTGKAQIMPKWAMGFWQSRERYKTQDELLDVLKEYRRRKIPIDNMVQDWSYWPEDAWGSHEFDDARFPDAKGMVDEVHRLNGRLMISVWPKFYHTTEHYRAFDRNGWMYRQAVEDSVRDWIGKGYIGSFYDAYSAGARKLFWEQMNEKLYSKGIDAWWMDASEPDILSNASMDYRKALSTPTALGPSTEFFNAYALMNAMAIYDGQRAVNPGSRVFLLTRSGFAGTQRYSTATWSGDIGTRWEDMKAQISAGLNFSLSGIPYWTMDIGGFCVERRYEQAAEGSEDLNEWRELNNRWFQFGAFCPLFRSHGQYPYREIFNIAPQGHPAYESMVHYNKLRYRLMPYIYSIAGKTHFDDYTIMRAMVMDFGSDSKTHNIGDQYMFGPSLLVAPVYEYKARERTVYFPENSGWYDFETQEYIRGGQWKNVAAPYERMPLFVKAGSILPMGEDIQHTAEPQTDLTIRIYTGADASFRLYEDEGTRYDYEKGQYSNIDMSYNEKENLLIISERKGSYPEMAGKRKIRIEWIFPGGKRVKAKTVNYNGSAIRIKP